MITSIKGYRSNEVLDKLMNNYYREIKSNVQLLFNAFIDFTSLAIKDQKKIIEVKQSINSLINKRTIQIFIFTEGNLISLDKTLGFTMYFLYFIYIFYKL